MFFLDYEFVLWTFIISINKTRLLIWNLNNNCSQWIIRSIHPEVLYKKLLLQISQHSQKILVLESLFNLVAGCQVYNFIKKSLQQKYFSMKKIAKFLKKPILKKICERLLLNNVAPNFSLIWRLQNRCSYKCFLAFAEKHLCMNVLCNSRPPT